MATGRAPPPHDVLPAPLAVRCDVPLFVTDGAEHVGERQDVTAAQHVERLSWDDVISAIMSGDVRDGLSLTALLWVLAFEREQR